MQAAHLQNDEKSKKPEETKIEYCVEINVTKQH